MKHIFFYLIILAAHLNCNAQGYPKVGEIFKYFKEQGLVKAYEISNLGGGYQEVLNVNITVTKNIDSKNSKDTVHQTTKEEQAVQHIKKLFSELQEQSIESYDYQYHTINKDSVIQSIIFKVDHEDKNIANSISSSNGYMHYRYTANSVDSTQMKGLANLQIRSYRDYERRAQEVTDGNQLLKRIVPILNNDSIKKHTIIRRFDKDFDGYDDEYARKNGFNFFSMIPRRMNHNEYNMLVCKFTEEEKAMDVLHKVMNCIRDYVATNPDKAFSILSDDYYDKNMAVMYNNICKTNMALIIFTHMDADGFYLLVRQQKEGTWTSDFIDIDKEWKTLKEIVDGEKSYYDEKI